MIFLAYATYFIHQWFFPGKSVQNGTAASPENSLIGFFIFGLPALWYTIFGRFALRKSEKRNDEA